jgi:hypothetical protein
VLRADTRQGDVIRRMHALNSAGDVVHRTRTLEVDGLAGGTLNSWSLNILELLT